MPPASETTARACSSTASSSRGRPPREGVEGVEGGNLGRAARGPDVLGDRFKLLAGAPGEEDPGAFAGVLPGDRTTD